MSWSTLETIRNLIHLEKMAKPEGGVQWNYEAMLAEWASKDRNEPVESLTELSEAEQQKLLNGLRKKLTNLQQQERV